MTTTRTPASTDAEVLIDLALDAAAEAWHDADEQTREALTNVLGSILHAEATPAAELINGWTFGTAEAIAHDEAKAKPQFTDRAYVRSHGRAPSRTTMGSWGFQRTSSFDAYDHQLSGEIFWANMATLAEAKRQLREAGHDGIWAVLP